MSYTLAILPDQDIQYKVRSWLGELGDIFELQDVPVTYTDRSSYHITLIYLGKKYSFSKRKLLQLKFRGYSYRHFDISLDRVRLGIARRRRDLLFLPVIDGASDLRNMVYVLNERLNVARDQMFIPHMTLGRVRKDLTDEEFGNLTQSISDLNSSKKISEIRFPVKNFSLVQFDQGVAKELRKFEI